MARVLVKDLIGSALDWAVAQCEGVKYQAQTEYDGIGNEYPPHRFSTNPDQAWGIIDRDGISVIRCHNDYGVDAKGYTTEEVIPVWCASKGHHGVERSTEHQSHDAMFQIYESDVMYGPTSLVAALRCKVASVYGVAMDVPDELVSIQSEDQAERAYAEAVRRANETGSAYMRAGDNGGVDPQTGKTKDELRALSDTQAAEAELLRTIANGVTEKGAFQAFNKSVALAAAPQSVAPIRTMHSLATPEGVVLKTFEVTGYGFDASTDATDDRVFWVKAKSHEEVRQAIAGTRAVFYDTIDAEDSIDFHLPAQASALREALLKFEASLTATSGPRVVVCVSGGCVTDVYSDMTGVTAVLHDLDNLKDLGRTSSELTTLFDAVTAGCDALAMTDSIGYLEASIPDTKPDDNAPAPAEPSGPNWLELR